MKQLPGDYISGFVDGEGGFSLHYRMDVRHDRPGSPIYNYWSATFAIYLHGADVQILALIKETLGCGTISLTAKGSARYQVAALTDLETIIVPFFDRYPLRARKKHDFALWKRAVLILAKNKQARAHPNLKWFKKTPMNLPDLQDLHELFQEMRAFKRYEISTRVRKR